MGYYIRAGLVTDNKATLEYILQCLKSDQPAVFDARHPSHVDRLHWQYQRLLKAAKELIDEEGGRYRHLRDMTKVTKVYNPPSIKIEKSAAGMLLEATPLVQDEAYALEEIKQYRGRVLPLNFTPSPAFDLETFRAQAAEHGFSIAVNGDDYIAYRSEERKGPSGFDLLS